MKTLIAMGSFKDVFSPIEMCELVGNSLNGTDIVLAPMCDGGEYTYDVLKYYDDMESIQIDNVVNPYGKSISARYLVAGNVAYIISSEILRLSSKEDVNKNPLELTDYGLGQIVCDAIKKGFREIKLCLGGTSTVGFGIGFAQAMGVRMFDFNGRLIKDPVAAKDIFLIDHIERGVDFCGDITVINDGITTARDLKFINPQKIGTCHMTKSAEILKKLDDILKRAVWLTGLDINTPFAGNAGGIAFGIHLVSEAAYVKGSDYFIRKFGIEEKMDNCDVVITGEGRLDNLHVEKLAVSISKLTMFKNKRLIFICGSRGDGITEESLLAYGIREVVCCEEHYADYETVLSGDVNAYHRLTPLIIKTQMEKMNGQ